MQQTTRIIEIDEDWNAWECENCGETWQFTEGTPQDNNYNYCCNCGRKIVEYVQYDNINDNINDNDYAVTKGTCPFPSECRKILICVKNECDYDACDNGNCYIK